jgi:hypothetical protein
MDNSVTENLSNVVAIASGYDHGLAVTADGIGCGVRMEHQLPSHAAHRVEQCNSD